MNTLDILKHGHQTVIEAVKGLDECDWLTPNVCGVWSVKNIVAHLASFEWVLAQVLASFFAAEPTKLLGQFATQEDFNDIQVAAREVKTAAEVLSEYKCAHEEVMTLAAQLPEETFSKVGTLPWYGTEYSLDDFVVYTYYGHKCEHVAQIRLHKRAGQAAVVV